MVTVKLLSTSIEEKCTGVVHLAWQLRDVKEMELNKPLARI